MELANIFAIREQFEKSVEMYNQVLSYWIEPSSKRSITMTKLGKALAGLGKFDDAIEHVNISMSWNEANLGGQHPTTLLTMHELATIFVAIGRY